MYTIICIYHERCPLRRKGFIVNSKAVVLRCDVAACGSHVDAGLIHTTVAVLHLVRLGTRGEGEDLVAKADAEDGLVLTVNGPANGLDAALSHGRISRAIGDEDAIPLELLRVCLKRVVVRDEGEAHPEVDEVADDIEFDAAVKGDDVRRGGVGRAVEVEATDLST